MIKKSISEIAKKMAAIDVAVLSTHTTGGHIVARPMSNNGEVEYDGRFLLLHMGEVPSLISSAIQRFRSPSRVRTGSG